MKYLNVILVSFVIVSCSGQNNRVNVSVKVIDEKGNGLPESQVEFTNQDTTFVTKTDFEGSVSLEGLKAGIYKIGASYVGHYSLKDYSVQINQEQQLSFELKTVSLDAPNVEWKKGWMTFEDEKGKVKSVRMKGE